MGPYGEGDPFDEPIEDVAEAAGHWMRRVSPDGAFTDLQMQAAEWLRQVRRDPAHAGLFEMPAPYDVEPIALGRAVGALDADAPAPEVIAARVAVWLREVLDAAGVERGAVDEAVVDALAEDWSTTTVVLGWVVRTAG